jgi:hypothetical protein
MYEPITAFPPDDELQEFLDAPSGETGFIKVDRHDVPEQAVALIGDTASTMFSLLGVP